MGTRRKKKAAKSAQADKAVTPAVELPALAAELLHRYELAAGNTKKRLAIRARLAAEFGIQITKDQ